MTAIKFKKEEEMRNNKKEAYKYIDIYDDRTAYIVTRNLYFAATLGCLGYRVFTGKKRGCFSPYSITGLKFKRKYKSYPF